MQLHIIVCEKSEELKGQHDFKKIQLIQRNSGEVQDLLLFMRLDNAWDTPQI